MDNELEKKLTAFFLETGRSNNIALSNDVNSILSLLAPELADAEKWKTTSKALLEDIREAETQDIFSHKAHNWLYAFKTRILNVLKGEGGE